MKLRIQQRIVFVRGTSEVAALPAFDLVVVVVVVVVVLGGCSQSQVRNKYLPTESAGPNYRFCTALSH